VSLYPIVRKELLSYFNSSIAYIVALFFLLFGNVWFLYLQRFLYQNVASMQGFFSIVPVIYILTLPAVTMRAWAEERRQGTDEVLLTLPFREWELVVGKFLASLCLLLVITALTIPLPLTLSPLGDFQSGPILGEYLGMILLGAAGLAIGQFVSAFSLNQATAFILSVVGLLFITLVDRVNSLMNLPSWAAGVFDYLSFNFHFNSFDKGLIDSRDVAYFIVVTVFFLYLTTRVLVLRKLR
jgi:ABC-2 type transport system permease protein